MDAPVLIKPITNQVVNEQAAYGPFDLKEYIQVPESTPIPSFRAELNDGNALPKGMICTADGIITGIPAKDTQGIYQVIVTAENEAGSATAEFVLTIKPSLLAGDTETYIDKLKSQVWEALEHNLPVPDLGNLYDRPITPLDIYYLLERWGVLTIWDAFNLEPPGEKRLLTLENMSEHYHVYDRGSCLVAAPKDLFSHERTIEDSLQTARAMAREVYKREWTIEMAGLDKMIRAAWVEVQVLGDIHGRRLEVINFNPNPSDLKLYNAQAQSLMRHSMD